MQESQRTHLFFGNDEFLIKRDTARGHRGICLGKNNIQLQLFTLFGNFGDNLCPPENATQNRKGRNAGLKSNDTNCRDAWTLRDNVTRKSIITF